jgi:hypothetical protein
MGMAAATPLRIASGSSRPPAPGGDGLGKDAGPIRHPGLGVCVDRARPVAGRDPALVVATVSATASRVRVLLVMRHGGSEGKSPNSLCAVTRYSTRGRMRPGAAATPAETRGGPRSPTPAGRDGPQRDPRPHRADPRPPLLVRSEHTEPSYRLMEECGSAISPISRALLMPLFKPSTLPSFDCTAPNAGPRRPRFARRTRSSADAGRQGVPPPRERLRARSHTGTEVSIASPLRDA